MKLDFTGVLLSAAGMFSLVYGIIEASTYGWWTAKIPYSLLGQTYQLWGYSITPFAIGLGLAILTAFLLWERRIEKLGKTPLVSLHLFSNRPYLSSVATTAIFALGQAGLIFSIPVFMQAVRGASAFETGLALIPMSITALFMAPLAGWLSHKIAPKIMVQVGLAAFVTGYLIVYLALNVNTTASDLVIPFVILGLGMGMMMSSISNMTLSAVSPEQAGEASGVNNTMRQVGATLGTAIIGAIMLTAINTNLVSGINSSAIIPSAFKQNADKIVSQQTSNVEFGGGAHIPGTVPLKIRNEITSISHSAITDANREALGYAIIFGIVGLFSTIWLPSGTNIDFAANVANRKTS